MPTAIAFSLAAVLLFFSPLVHAQQSSGTLLEDDTIIQKYILELSGTVLNENFNGVIMMLKFSGAPMGSPHPYLLLAGGFPDEQTRNSFYWNSEESTLEVSANQITCKINEGALKTSDIHFFYLSPALLKRTLTHKDKEDRQKTLKTAVPPKVFAQAGELKLTIDSVGISGSVWLQGYDTIQKSYVRYSASFTGRRAEHVEQKLQRKHK
jgi:hypothetical protein